MESVTLVQLAASTTYVRVKLAVVEARVESATDSSEEEYPAFGKKRNRLHTPVPRSSWQMEALEAMRLGDVFRLRTVYERKGANVNLATKEKAYGGFRYITWGPKSYGGEPDGETMLHLAVRPDNGRYPNRHEVVECLIEAGVDVNLRSGDDRTPRDLNTLLMDTVYPIKGWTVKDAHAFFLSAGKRVKVAHLTSWLKVFDAYRVDGLAIMGMWSDQAFRTWVDERLADLTRVGITAVALEEETPRWIFELERIVINGGARGVLVEIDPQVLRDLLGVVEVSVTTARGS